MGSHWAFWTNKVIQEGQSAYATFMWPYVQKINEYVEADNKEGFRQARRQYHEAKTSFMEEFHERFNEAHGCNACEEEGQIDQFVACMETYFLGVSGYELCFSNYRREYIRRVDDDDAEQMEYLYLSDDPTESVKLLKNVETLFEYFGVDYKET